MDTLSSCYFCSTALDASLAEYPVVPVRLRTGDPDRTVVLCDTCARKLDAVFESVVAAVEADAADGGSAAGGPAEQTESRGADADSLESTLGDDEDVLRSVGDSEGDDTGGGTGDEGEAASADEEATDAGSTETEESDEKERTYSDARGAGFRRDDDGGSTRPTLRDDSDDAERKYSDSRGAGFRRDDDRGTGGFSTLRDDSEDDADSDESDAQSDDRDVAETTDDGHAGDDADSGTGGDSTDDGNEGDSTDDGTGGGDTPDISMTRLENTKVMRLLENREFPVDKEEFVTVAASAYQISREDCEKVLDLAVQHGLIHEEDGQLVGGDL